MASRDLNDAEKILRDAYIKAAKMFTEKYPEVTPVVTCTYRSETEQAELYALGRTKPGKIVTQLKKGSKHNTKPSQAIDVAFKVGKDIDWDVKHFRRFAEILLTLEPRIEWGGHWKKFKDYPHFEI
jgi:peptidoglycan L-alanyl-D-glutamate endopeptidase CwlK